MSQTVMFRFIYCFNVYKNKVYELVYTFYHWDTQNYRFMFQVPIRVQSPPVTSSSTSNLLGLAMTALNSTSSPYSLSDSAIDQTQPDTDE